LQYQRSCIWFFFAAVKVWITLSFSNLYRHDVDCSKRTKKSRENEEYFISPPQSGKIEFHVSIMNRKKTKSKTGILTFFCESHAINWFSYF